MTREEAVTILRNEQPHCGDKIAFSEAEKYEALNMAIEALEREPIIRCKDCKYWHEWENGTGSCHRSDIMWVGSDYYDYCSFAEKRGSDGE